MQCEQLNMNSLNIQILFMTLFCKITITIKPGHITDIQELIFTTDLLGTKSYGLRFVIKKLKRRQTK